jgi:hypothetical protein
LFPPRSHPRRQMRPETPPVDERAAVALSRSPVTVRRLRDRSAQRSNRSRRAPLHRPRRQGHPGDRGSGRLTPATVELDKEVDVAFGHRVTLATTRRPRTRAARHRPRRQRPHDEDQARPVSVGKHRVEPIERGDRPARVRVGREVAERDDAEHARLVVRVGNVVDSVLLAAEAGRPVIGLGPGERAFSDAVHFTRL